jgi:probable HAF family extracellular repeat protein
MKSQNVESLAILAFAALGIVPVAAQAQLVDLGVATGYAINNAGQVVLSTGIYNNGTITPLPTLPGQTTPALGVAINATGQVAGSAGISTSDPPYNVPVEFSSGTLTSLVSTEGYATGINSGAEIVGYTVREDIGSGNTNQGYFYDGFIYVNGTQMSLPVSGNLPTTNTPRGINDSDQITGIRSIQDPNNPETNRLDAYIYDYRTGVTTDLGEGSGQAINATGQVTGYLGANSPYAYAFLYSNGTAANLGTLPGGTGSYGWAIDSIGDVVGAANTAGGIEDYHAFFYNGAMNDLNTLIEATDPLKRYVTLRSAVGINDSRLILANGVDLRTNLTHAYLYQASFIELAPVTLNFSQAVGGTTQAQSVTVTNAGTAAIPIGTAYVNGDFSLRTDSCGASLAPGAQCRIGVVFVPKLIGVLTGALTIPSAGANYQVPLSGTGTIDANVTAGSSTATVGQPLTLTWTVTAGSTCTASSASTNPAWTASKPPFAGKVPLSGKQTLTETVDGTMYYVLNCTAPGVPTVNVGPKVVWAWPAVTATISASPTTITAGQSTTLTWKSSNATSCTASGGGADDNWTGTKATSGSQTVTEAVALDTSSVALTFGITCNSTTSGLSDKASVNVTENQASATPPPTSSGGGGGALNPLSLAFLAGIVALRRVRARIASR